MSLVPFSTRKTEDDYARRRDALLARIGPLPAPRIWMAEDLARFLNYSIHFVYNQTRRSRADRPPRCPNMREIRFDTHSLEFLLWLAARLGIDVSDLEGEDG